MKVRAVLVVEDDPGVREYLAQLVVSAFPDARVVQAANALEARDILGGAVFDLAVIDLELGVGSGIDIVAAIKASQASTYCVIATTFQDEGHIFSALQVGANGYLLKSESRSRLVQRLVGITLGDPPLSPDIARRLVRHFAELRPEQDGKLTAREREILMLIGKGLSRPEVAEVIGISPNTVNDHVKSIYRKLNVSSRAEAAVAAARLGLI